MEVFLRISEVFFTKEEFSARGCRYRDCTPLKESHTYPTARKGGHACHCKVNSAYARLPLRNRGCEGNCRVLNVFESTLGPRDEPVSSHAKNELLLSSPFSPRVTYSRFRGCCSLPHTMYTSSEAARVSDQSGSGSCGMCWCRCRKGAMWHLPVHRRRTFKTFGQR